MTYARRRPLRSSFLPSTPETVYKGPFSPNVPPVLHIKSGDTVLIDTVNGRGGKDATTFFAKAGVSAKDILHDEDVINNMPPKDFGFAHPGGKTMTGPIYIEVAPSRATSWKYGSSR